MFQVLGSAEEHPCPCNKLAWSKLRWRTTSSRWVGGTKYCHNSFFSKTPPKSPYYWHLYQIPSTFLPFTKVTRGQHIEAGGREESGSQLTWREEGSSLLAWRRQERRSVLAWRRGDKESLLSWRRSWLEDGCLMCGVSSAQRCLRGAGHWQEMDQPGSCYAGAHNS